MQHQPKSVPMIGIILFIIPFIIVGLAMFIPLIAKISIFHSSFISWKVIDYSSQPQISFIYQNKEYKIASDGNTTCSGRPCNEIGDAKWILLNKNIPEKSLLVFDLLFAFIMLVIPMWAVAVWVHFYKQDRKRHAAITEMQNRWSYLQAIIIDVEKNYSSKWNLLWYTYLCKSESQNKIYKSDSVHDVFELWTTVRVYESEYQFPWIYWVDLSTVSSHGSIQTWDLQKYYDDKNKRIHEESMNQRTIVLSPILACVTCGILSFGFGIFAWKQIWINPWLVFFLWFFSVFWWWGAISNLKKYFLSKMDNEVWAKVTIQNDINERLR